MRGVPNLVKTRTQSPARLSQTAPGNARMLCVVKAV